MPEQDLVQQHWSAALAAANDELKGVGGKTPASQRPAIRTRAASAAARVFHAAKAPIKVVRVDIDWSGDKPEASIEVITMKGDRYPREATPTIEAPRVTSAPVKVDTSLFGE